MGGFEFLWQFDKETKLELIKEGFKAIEDDAAFLNEYSKMTGKSKEEIIKIFEAYKSTLTYRVKNGKEKKEPSYQEKMRSEIFAQTPGFLRG